MSRRSVRRVRRVIFGSVGPVMGLAGLLVGLSIGG
jgi:hypothetical protein